MHEIGANPWQRELSGPLRAAFRTPLPRQHLLYVALVAIDLLMVVGGLSLAYLLRFESSIAWVYQHQAPPRSLYSVLGFLLVPGWVLIFWWFGLYDIKHLFAGMHEYARAFNACTLGIMLLILVTFFDPTLTVARGWVILSWFLVTLGVLLGRFMLRRVVQRMRTRGHFQTRALVVGANEEGQAIAEQLQLNRKLGICVAGFADDRSAHSSRPPSGVPILGEIDTVPGLVEKHGIQEIIVASTALSHDRLLELIQAFAIADDVGFSISPGFYDILATRVEVQALADVPLLNIAKFRLSRAEMAMKRGMDLLVAGGLLLVCWPLMLIVAAAIKLDSAGSVIYRRPVLGVGNKPFHAFKFRTMYKDADQRLASDPELRLQFEQNFKLTADPRVTRVGRLLRRTSLDELPQLFNVLWGQMSLVGPRMITRDEQSRYGKWRLNLATVKPGITGLWQVSGRSDVSYEDRVMLDMYYIRNYSIWLDLHLLYRTIPAVLGGRGAY
jgi:exopolysaccharide biosynthesis polyprenyl glycosylphosphotransferase